MITSIKHKGLKLLWTKGDKRKVPTMFADKIERLLVIIEFLNEVPKDLEPFVNLDPHPLKGDLKGYWSIKVTGNWRIIFRFDNDNATAYDLDLLDYH